MSWSISLWHFTLYGFSYAQLAMKIRKSVTRLFVYAKYSIQMINTKRYEKRQIFLDMLHLQTKIMQILVRTHGLIIRNSNEVLRRCFQNFKLIPSETGTVAAPKIVNRFLEVQLLVGAAGRLPQGNRSRVSPTAIRRTAQGALGRDTIPTSCPIAWDALIQFFWNFSVCICTFWYDQIKQFPSSTNRNDIHYSRNFPELFQCACLIFLQCKKPIHFENKLKIHKWMIMLLWVSWWRNIIDTSELWQLGVLSFDRTDFDKFSINPGRFVI